MCVYIQPDIAMYGDDEGEESLGAEDQGKTCMLVCSKHYEVTHFKLTTIKSIPTIQWCTTNRTSYMFTERYRIQLLYKFNSSLKPLAHNNYVACR